MPETFKIFMHQSDICLSWSYLGNADSTQGAWIAFRALAKHFLFFFFFLLILNFAMWWSWLTNQSYLWIKPKCRYCRAGREGCWCWERELAGTSQLDSVVKANIWSHTSICRPVGVHICSQLFEGRWRGRSQYVSQYAKYQGSDT